MTTEAEGEQEVIEGTKRARDNELVEDTKPKRARRQPRLQRQLPSTIDRSQNPLFIIDRSVYLLTSSPYYKDSYKVLAEISEPKSRPTYIHEYEINQSSIIKAIALGYTKDKIIGVLMRYMRNDHLPEETLHIINTVSKKYNCAKMYLEQTDSGNFVFLEMNLNTYKELTVQQRQLFDSNPDVLVREEENGDIAKYRILQYKQNRFAEVLSSLKIPFHLEYAFNTKRARMAKKFLSQLQVNIQGGSYPLKDLKIELRTFTKLRNYQEAALKAIFFMNDKKEELAKSGLIVLPCGAGKTLLGISTCCKIKKDTLIVCSGDVLVEQWRREILKWTSEIHPDQITVLTSRTDKFFKFNPKDDRGMILISTYSYLANKLMDKRDGSFREYEWIAKLPWGLAVFDEVQSLPASGYQNIMYNIQCHVKIGLTATPHRQDKKIENLNYLIGPLLYEGNWRDFVDAGYLANPYCIEIRASMTPYFSEEYSKRELAKESRQFLYSVNPNKIKALIYLIKVHEDRGDSTIVFCDSIPLIRYIYRTVKVPHIYSEAPQEDKNFVFEYFRRGKFKTILVSRVGDEAIDLPNANVAIQLNIHKGSRKQVLQRLGRIMRPKDNPTHEYNAYFYTLVSEGTSEKIHFNKRQKCLVDLGFQYDIINEKDLEYNDPTSPYYSILKQYEIKNEVAYLRDELRG